MAAQAAAVEEEAVPEPVVEEKSIFDVKLIGVDPTMKVSLVFV